MQFLIVAFLYARAPICYLSCGISMAYILTIPSWSDYSSFPLSLLELESCFSLAEGKLLDFSFCLPLHLASYKYHAREPLYSNSAVIAWCSQSSGAQNKLFWFTVIHSMNQYFTAFNFHDIFFIWNYCLGIVVHSGPIRAFKF